MSFPLNIELTHFKHSWDFKLGVFENKNGVSKYYSKLEGNEPNFTNEELCDALQQKKLGAGRFKIYYDASVTITVVKINEILENGKLVQVKTHPEEVAQKRNYLSMGTFKCSSNGEVYLNLDTVSEQVKELCKDFINQLNVSKRYNLYWKEKTTDQYWKKKSTHESFIISPIKSNEIRTSGMKVQGSISASIKDTDFTSIGDDVGRDIGIKSEFGDVTLAAPRVGGSINTEVDTGDTSIIGAQVAGSVNIKSAKGSASLLSSEVRGPLNMQVEDGPALLAGVKVAESVFISTKNAGGQIHGVETGGDLIIVADTTTTISGVTVKGNLGGVVGNLPPQYASLFAPYMAAVPSASLPYEYSRGAVSVGNRAAGGEYTVNSGEGTAVSSGNVAGGKIITAVASQQELQRLLQEMPQKPH